MTAYQIHPTGPEGNQETLYTDTSLSNLLNIVANQINSTRQVLWQRYAAMLLANSFFSGLLFNSATNPQATVIGAEMGATAAIMLSSFWIVMFLLDWWTFHYKRLAVATRFEWTQLPSEANPFKEMMQENVALLIYLLAFFVAVLFLIVNITLYQNWPTR